MTTRLLRMPEVEDRLGMKSSSIYNWVNEGMLPSPVRVGKRTSAWPDYEIQAIVGAIIGGKSKEELKEMSRALVHQRMNKSSRQ